LHATPSNGLKAARERATFFLMKTNEKDMETDIKKLALAHAEAAIQVLADVMNNADAPAGARISAAKALLDRGFGKVTTQKPEEEETREPQVIRFERVIIDPKETHPERFPGYTHVANDQLPAEEEEVLDQLDQDQDQAQRAPPEVGEFSDYTTRNYGEWG